MPHLMSVEFDRRNRVESLEDQFNLVGIDRAPRECRRVAPVRHADPAQKGFVVVKVRVGDEASGKQIGVHRAGYGRFDRFGAYFRRYWPPEGAECPFTRERPTNRNDGVLACHYLVAPEVIPL